MVLLAAYASHEEEQNRQQCESNKRSASCAYDVLNAKFKRPKVYAIRNFPKGFELLSAQTKPLGSVCTFGNLLGKKVTEDYSVEPFEINVACQQISVNSEMDNLSNNLKSMEETIVASDSEEVVELDDSKFIYPLKFLEQESIGLIHSMKSIGRLEVKNVLEDEALAQEMDELSCLKMRHGTLPKIYFRRRLTAIQSFPPGCGSHAANFSKEDCLKALASSKKGSGCQKSTMRKQEVAVGVSEGKGKREHLMTDMEEADRKLSGESTHMNQLQVGRVIGSDHLAGKVVVQALMAGQRCPWRQSSKDL